MVYVLLIKDKTINLMNENAMSVNEYIIGILDLFALIVVMTV